MALFHGMSTRSEMLDKQTNLINIFFFVAPFKPNNWIARFVRYLLHGYSMDVDSWLERSQAIFGLLTFQESFELTGRILNISLSRAGAVGESLVLNYQNAPNVLIFSAVVASSGFPFLGVPLYLQEKDKTGNIVTSAEYHGRYFQGNFYTMDHCGTL